MRLSVFTYSWFTLYENQHMTNFLHYLKYYSLDNDYNQGSILYLCNGRYASGLGKTTKRQKPIGALDQARQLLANLNTSGRTQKFNRHGEDNKNNYPSDGHNRIHSSVYNSFMLHCYRISPQLDTGGFLVTNRIGNGTASSLV